MLSGSIPIEATPRCSIENTRTLYTFLARKSQGETRRRVRDEMNRFQIRDIKSSVVDYRLSITYDPLHHDCAAFEGQS